MNFWHDIEKPIIGLSPMDGVTDASFRLVAARHGRPDLCMTEFTSVEAICCGADGFVRDFVYGECERPVLAQIYGRTPEAFYQVAHVVCELGFDGLDINMGCPAKNVANKGCGAGLILNPRLAVTLIRAARRGIEDWAAGQRLEDIGLAPDVLERVRSMCHGQPWEEERRAIPLSVKTRVGYDRVQVDEWIPVLLDERPAALSVHGRTLKQMYKGFADWDAIARVVELARGTGILVLGNGDLKSMADVVERVRRTGVDGVLLGRGAMGNPWVFRDKRWAKDALARGAEFDAAPPDVSQEERTRVLLEHSRHFEGLWGERRFPAMRKHLAWYCKGFRGAAQWRARMVQARNAAEVARIVGAG
ncbi:MAG: tRNA-dihydrouridine synthase [Deltaproteobacteria bacterium]|nr:tRNA-dihydrouridine synthase [Deltaproteobacteria bacterium]